MAHERKPVAARPVDLMHGDRKDLDRSLGRLVVGLVDALRLILERQAVRRAEGGRLSAAETERLGDALIALEEKTSELKQVFRMEPGDVTLPMGRLEGREVTLVDTVDALLSKGVVLDGRLAILLSEIELLRLGLQIVVASPDILESD